MTEEGQLVKFDTDNIVFPQRCPVCGEPATTEGVIPAVSELERRKSRTPSIPIGPYGAHYSPRMMPEPGFISKFHIPTCEEHGVSYEDTARYKGPLALCSGLMIILSFLIVLWIILGFTAYTPVDSTAYIVLGLVVVVGIGSYFASGPNELEKAISVVDISPKQDFVVLQITNPHYLEDILRMNPLTAKKVKRVVTSSY
jgi:hypothetical protein